MLPNRNLADWTLRIAKSELGKREATGHNDGPFVNMLQRFVADGAKWLDGQPWCACFATWCIYQAAEHCQATPILKKTASSSSLYSDAKEKGLLLGYPVPPCIGLIRGDGGSLGKTHEHTFIVASYDGQAGTISGIDGNWRNAVSLTTHNIPDCDFVAIA